VFNWKVSKWEI